LSITDTTNILDATDDARSPGLAQLFSEQVRVTPHDTAVTHRGTSITYRELDAWSNAIAGQLAPYELGPERPVALGVPRSPAVVAAILAFRKLGTPFVAVDPELPRARQRQILEHAQPVLELRQSGSEQDVPIAGPQVALAGMPAHVPAPPDPVPERPGEVFQIVYTSGTTGAPRGVAISVGAVRNRLEWMWAVYPFPEGAVVCAHKSYALVAAFWELLGGLLAGRRSVILSREEILDSALLCQAIEREGITHCYLTPPLIESLLLERERRTHAPSPLQLVTSGADVLRPDTVHRFHEALPGVVLLNLYGLTECASNVAAFDTARLASDATRVPVGRPIANTGISVRDRAGRQVPIGVQGELHVSGRPVATGYFNDEALTAERFTVSDDGERTFNTGDIGRWLPSGDLEIIGRADNQIKVRGYRVELEEVEGVLASAPGVASADVVHDGHGTLVGCVERADGAEPSLDAVRAFVRDRLPEYMVPGRIECIGRIPLNAGGKIDRTALSRLAERHEMVGGTGRRASGMSELQTRIAGIWERLVGSPPEAVDQDFFEAGGHSLLAVQLVGHLRQELDCDLALRDFFDDPTVAGLAAALGERDATTLIGTTGDRFEERAS
jgi:amino acid adenylation domain-containing protein